MARRSLRPQLNQIRTWVRQGRTDAWIAHQLEVSARDITNFKREHDLEATDTAEVETDLFGPRVDEEEVDLRAEDEKLVAAALEEEEQRATEESDDEDEDEDEDDGDRDGDDGESDKPRRRRGRRGGRGRRRGGEGDGGGGGGSGGGGGRGRGGSRGGKALEGTFDHGEDGYGLWLDPAIQDDAVYAEHWAGHRAVKVTVEQNKITIERT